MRQVQPNRRDGVNRESYVRNSTNLMTHGKWRESRACAFLSADFHHHDSHHHHRHQASFYHSSVTRSRTDRNLRCSMSWGIPWTPLILSPMFRWERIFFFDDQNPQRESHTFSVAFEDRMVPMGLCSRESYCNQRRRSFVSILQMCI